MPTETFSFNPELLSILHEDPEFKAEITKLFEEDGTQLLGELELAIEASDSNRVDEAAHALKGIFSNTGIQELWQVATDLDMLAKQNLIEAEKPKAVELYLTLKAQFEKAVVFVKAL